MSKSLEYKVRNLLINAFTELLKVDLTIIWQYFKAHITLDQLLKYENTPKSQIPEYITKDKIEVDKWKEYTDEQNTKLYGNKEINLAWNWIPNNWIEYFARRAKRKNVQNGTIEIIENYYPNTVTPLCELVYWQNDVLNISKDMKKSMQEFTNAGLCSLIYAHGYILTHIFEFAKP